MFTITRRTRIRLVDLVLYVLGYGIPALFLNFMLHVAGVPVPFMFVIDIAGALAVTCMEARS